MHSLWYGPNADKTAAKPVRVSLLLDDEKIGTVWLLQTRREWLELRLTPSGLIRPGKPVRGTHPVMKEAD